MTTILVAEDDDYLRARCCAVLADSGHGALGARSGAEALGILGRRRIDLLVADADIQTVNGLELVRMLRADGRRLPVIMISSRGEERDKYAGFAAGADDYLVKPLYLPEIVWRANALLRRSQIFPDRLLTVGSTVLDRDTLSVRSGDADQELTAKEFRLLFKLAANIGRIVTRPQLIDCAWGADGYAEEHSLDVHMSRLRGRLKATDLSIVTVRGLGYKLVCRNAVKTP